MEQPSYQPKPGQVEEMVGRIFTDPDDRSRVVTQLDRYTEFYPESERVRLGILKLSNGDAERVEGLVDLAMIDYRDVLAAAEYPAYMKLRPGIDPTSPEAQEAIRADWAQYTEWADS